MQSRFQKCRVLCCGLVAAGWPIASAQAVTLGQIEEFTIPGGGWRSGASLNFIATGGPAGAGDGYLEISRPDEPDFLGVYTVDPAWGGETTMPSDYVGAGVGAITMDVVNFGPAPVELRILMEAFDGAVAWSTTSAFNVSPAGTWRRLRFELSEAEMTEVRNDQEPSLTLADTLGAVERFLIRHDPGPVSSTRENPGGAILTTIGIDNLKAEEIPEPGVPFLIALAAGLGGVRRVRTARGSKRGASGHSRDPVL